MNFTVICLQKVIFIKKYYRCGELAGSERPTVLRFLFITLPYSRFTYSVLCMITANGCQQN
jgi:hypothetical protein